jgi:hypothetical protein
MQRATHRRLRANNSTHSCDLSDWSLAITDLWKALKFHVLGRSVVEPQNDILPSGRVQSYDVSLAPTK